MSKNQKLILSVNIALTCAIFIGNYFYLTIGTLAIKSLCSSGFALIGIINLCYALYSKTQNSRFCISMAIGLVFACLGDIFLGFNFVLGAGLFAIGHICYFLAYCMLEQAKMIDVVISLAIFLCAGSFILFCPLLTFPDLLMKCVCLVYALIISFMVGKAIGNFVKKRSLVTVILFIGSVLFFFSDLMLVFDWFMNMGRISGWLCMATYYPAECLLAISVLLSLLNNKRNI